MFNLELQSLPATAQLLLSKMLSMPISANPEGLLVLELQGLHAFVSVSYSKPIGVRILSLFIKVYVSSSRVNHLLLSL
jgi:hypothetical protein